MLTAKVPISAIAIIILGNDRAMNENTCKDHVSNTDNNDNI